MRLNIVIKTLLAASILSAAAANAAEPADRVYQKALTLYEQGMFARAQSLFNSLGDNPLAEGYSVLCSMKMKSADSEMVYNAYRAKYVSSSLEPLMCFQNALNLFDEGRFAEASPLFARLDTSLIPEKDRAEAAFKYGYCCFAQGDYAGARAKFGQVEDMPVNDYTTTARYLTAYMDYSTGQFASALPNFHLALPDVRFAETCRFYIVDCEFNLKNYDFVLDEGIKVYEDSPEARRSHLARMISESYLVKGDKESAREYYEVSSHDDMSRSDYFYAGSVLYAVEDYQGAIENFTKMTDRSDSLGQIANYQLANSYIRTRRNVAAMDAFRDASEFSYDPRIQEDAFFNYSKLAFDLNKDTSGFEEYIKRYSTRTRGDRIYSYMALAALYNRNYAAAVDAYDNIDELTPDMRNNYTKANFLRGEQLVRNGAYRDAIPCLRAAAYYLPKTDRLNQFSRYWMAEAQYDSGNYAEAASVFTDLYNNSALDGTPEGKLTSYNAAYSYFLNGDYKTASRWFDTYLSDGTCDYRKDALTRRADCLFAEREYKAAIPAYQGIVNEYSSPDEIYPYYQLALCYGLSNERNGKKKKAETLARVEKASSDSPMYDEAMYELGRSRSDIKDYSGASVAFQTLRANTKDSTYAAKALIGLGMANRNVKEYERALAYYKEVVALMPGSAFAEDAMLAIESIYQTTKQPQKYIEYVEQNSLIAKKSESDKEDMYFNTAEQIYLNGNSQQAIQSLHKFMEEFPQSTKIPQAWFYLAESHRSLGEKEQACECYAKVCEMSSEGSFAESARLGYADVSYSLERYSDAYQGYSNLADIAKMDANRTLAAIGQMRSAFRSRDFVSAINAASGMKSRKGVSADVLREADYIWAKSLMATSQRAEALKKFADLAMSPSTDEGAEAKFILIQDIFDTGDFDKVESAVYEFSQKAGNQSYWLAKSYIVLGDTFLERGMISQAQATFESIRDGYEPTGPTDDVLDNVKIRLQRIQNQ